MWTARGYRNSTRDELREEPMSERRPAALVAAVALLPGLVAAVLGVLTFGAQASARPDESDRSHVVL
ncbi:hypothetical protein GCM10023148_49500 [Actinokineospora soli]